MFDFRYHALSLAAVFLALGVGIVLGVTLGDSLVSEADQNIRESLRGDVVDARSDLRATRSRLARRDELIGSLLPEVAEGRLRGDRVALVAWGPLPEEVEASVREAVEAGGGEIDSVTVIDERVGFDELGAALGGRFARLREDGGLVDAAGEAVGRSIVRGGRPVTLLERELPERFAGDYRGAASVAYHHSPPSARSARGDSDEQVERRRELERALISGLESEGVPIVGVEASDTEPSQIGFYEDRGLASVDSVDTVGGRLALVLALAGARGAFGFKDSAEEPIPELSTRPAAP